MNTNEHGETVYYDQGGFLVTDKRISTSSGTTIRLCDVRTVQVTTEREGAFTSKSMVPCSVLAIVAAVIYFAAPGLNVVAIICAIAAVVWFFMHLEPYFYYKLVVECVSGPVSLSSTYGSKQPESDIALQKERAEAISNALARSQN